MNLKQSLDAGALVYICDRASIRIVTMYRDADTYVMIGRGTRHELNVAQTDADRLAAHWNGFSETCIAQAHAGEQR